MKWFEEMVVITFISSNSTSRTRTSAIIRTAPIVIESTNTNSDSNSDQIIVDHCMPFLSKCSFEALLHHLSAHAEH